MQTDIKKLLYTPVLAKLKPLYSKAKFAVMVCWTICQDPSSSLKIKTKIQIE